MGIFQALTTIISTSTKEVGKIRSVTPQQWKYDILNTPVNHGAKLFQNSNFPILRGSDELWPLAKSAVDSGNKANISKVLNHIYSHQAQGIESYQKILKFLYKAMEEMDFIHFFL
jgi:hypothetical protein